MSSALKSKKELRQPRRLALKKYMMEKRSDNRVKKTQLKTAIAKFVNLMTIKSDMAKVNDAFSNVQSFAAKLKKHGVFHKNKVSRIVSHLNAKFKKYVGG